MATIGAVLASAWEAFFLSSPYVLVGLGVAGLVNVWFRPAQVARWLGKPGLGSMTAAALIGMPLPLCSCAVVPVTIELSRKGASREASLAFLVSTPETGVDSILLTWGLMGPLMAVCRPLAALLTSLVAALASMFATRRERRRAPGAEPAAPDPQVVPGVPPAAPSLPDERSWLRRASTYAFVGLIDEIGFWLLLGFLLTGAIATLVPDGLFASVGHGPLAMLFLLLLGIPLYMCASASTPIAAALMLKGVSPGAALVFLLSGPATNAAALVLVARFFGRGFVRLYLGSIVVVALASGLLLDGLVAGFGWQITPKLAAVAGEAHGWLDWTASLVLLALILWRSWHGALLRGAHEFADNMKKLVLFPARANGAGGSGSA